MRGRRWWRRGGSRRKEGLRDFDADAEEGERGEWGGRREGSEIDDGRQAKE